MGLTEEELKQMNRNRAERGLPAITMEHQRGVEASYSGGGSPSGGGSTGSSAWGKNRTETKTNFNSEAAARKYAQEVNGTVVQTSGGWSVRSAAYQFEVGDIEPSIYQPYRPAPDGGSFDIGNLRDIRSGLPDMKAAYPWQHGLDWLYRASQGMDQPDYRLNKLDPSKAEVPLNRRLENTSQASENFREETYDNLQQSLSGKPDLGQLARLDAIERRNMSQFGQPAIEAAFAGGPYGEKSEGALNSALASNQAMMGDAQAGRRFQEVQQAKDRQMAATGLMADVNTATANIQQMEQQNMQANANRAIEVHFRNEGLTLEEARFESMMLSQALAEASAVSGSALNAASFEVQQQQFNANLALQEENLGLQAESAAANNELALEQLRIQKAQIADAQKASAFSAIGTIAGMAIGAATGGLGLIGAGGAINAAMGASIGGGLGGGAGQALGGGGYAPLASNVAQAPMNMYMMSKMMAPQTGGNMYGSPLGNADLYQRAPGGHMEYGRTWGGGVP